MKLEKASPASDASPSRAPVVQEIPSSGASAAVARVPVRTPLMVLLCPNRGRPSANLSPPSRGYAHLSRSNHLASTGEPLAASNSSKSLMARTNVKATSGLGYRLAMPLNDSSSWSSRIIGRGRRLPTLKTSPRRPGPDGSSARKFFDSPFRTADVVSREIHAACISVFPLRADWWICD
jgi:hypothetical protein